MIQQDAAAAVQLQVGSGGEATAAAADGSASGGELSAAAMEVDGQTDVSAAAGGGDSTTRHLGFALQVRTVTASTYGVP